MKIVKYIISFCILFVGLLIIGESHIFRLNNFYTEFDNTTLYLQRDTTEKEMINDTFASATRNGVEIFTFIRSPRSTLLTEYKIYGTSGIEDYINGNLNIFAKTYTSLFLGDINFTFNDLRNIHGIENIHDFYVIGNKENVHKFKMDLIDKYAGNHPKDGFVNNDSKYTIIAIWLLIISIILFLSFYDVIFQKKENLIRVFMGEKISKICWRNILLDSIVITLLFTIVLYTLSMYTYVFFEFSISLILFFILLFSNALLYLNLYFYNLKEVISNAKGSNKLLALNYGLKLVTVIITIFVISSNVALIFESYSLYKQKSFFQDHSDYFYVRIEYRNMVNADGSVTVRFKDSTLVQEAFYREFFKKFDATLLSTVTGISNRKGIIANKNAFGYLSNEIKELRGLTLKKDIYFILPKKFSGDATIIDALNLQVRFYEGDNFKYDFDIIYYGDNLDVISIDEMHTYGSELQEDPVIIYNNVSVDTLDSQIEGDFNKINYVNDIMYKISSDVEFSRFIQDHHLADQIVTKTNVLEKYNTSWIIAKRILYINFIFSILVLILEFIIITSIIKLEYEVNAIELSIKKVMGYGTLAKNSKIILMTGITTILSIISAVFAAILVGLDSVYYLAIGGIVILVLELLVISFYIRKIENVKVPKILKGGYL